MRGHEELCPTPYRQLATCRYCDLISRVRADERAKAPRHSTGTDTGGPCCECCYDVHDLLGDLSDCRHWAKENVLALAHAEAVAARLVEVICEQEAKADRRVDRFMLMTARKIAEARGERDAALAERDRLRAEVADLAARLNGGSIR